MIVLISPAAAEDIERIGDHIHAANPPAAIRFVKSLRERCSRIADAPEGGTRRWELRPDLRSVVFRKYLIFYTATQSHVRIERVMHGARDIDANFVRDR